MGENVFYRVAKEHAQNFVQQNPGAVFPTNAKFCAILMHTHDIVAGFTGISMCNGVVSTVAAEYLAMSEMSKLGHTKALQMVTISLRDFSVSVPDASELSLLSAFDPENYKCAVFVTPYDKVTLGELLGVETDVTEESVPYEAPAPAYAEPAPQPEAQPVQQNVSQTPPRRNVSARSVDEMSVNDILNEVMESNKAAASAPAPVEKAAEAPVIAEAPKIEPAAPVEAPDVEPVQVVEAPKLDVPVVEAPPAVEPASVGDAPEVESASVDAAPEIEPAAVEPATVEAAPDVAPASVEEAPKEEPVEEEKKAPAEEPDAPVEEAPAAEPENEAPVEEAPSEDAPAAEEAPELTQEAMGGFDFFSGFGDEDISEGQANMPENWEEMGFIKSDAPDPEKLAAVSAQHEKKAVSEFARDVSVDESNPFYAEQAGSDADNKVAYFAEIPEDDPEAEQNGGIPVISAVGTHTAEGSAEIISKDDLLKEAKKRKKIAKANFGFRRK